MKIIRFINTKYKTSKTLNPKISMRHPETEQFSSIQEEKIEYDEAIPVCNEHQNLQLCSKESTDILKELRREAYSPLDKFEMHQVPLFQLTSFEWDQPKMVNNLKKIKSYCVFIQIEFLTKLT